MFMVIILFLLLFGILTWKKYDWAFLVLVAGLPSYLIRFQILGLPFTLLEGMFWVVFVFWFRRKFLEIKKLGTNNYLQQRMQYPFAKAIMLFAVASFIGVAVTGFSTAALGIYKAYFIEAILFFVLVFDYLKGDLSFYSFKSSSSLLSDVGGATSPHPHSASSGQVNPLLKERESGLIVALSTSALVVSLYAIYQRLTGQMWYGDVTRVTSVYPYPNAVGLYLGPIVVLLWFYLISKIQETKYKIQTNIQYPISNIQSIIKFSILFLSVILSSVAILLAKSDGAIIGVAIAIFVGSIFINKRFAVATLSLGAIAIGLIFFVPSLRFKVVQKATLSDFSGEVRKQQWRETWQVFENGKFISGCGLSDYQACVKPYHQSGIFFNKDNDPRFRNNLVWGSPEYKTTHWFPVEIYMYPHNFFLNFWSEMSITGLIAIIILVVQFEYYGIRILFGNWKLKIENSAQAISDRERIMIIGLLSTMLEILIHGAVDVPYFKNDLSFQWWIWFALLGWQFVKFKNSKSINQKYEK